MNDKPKFTKRQQREPPKVVPQHHNRCAKCARRVDIVMYTWQERHDFFEDGICRTCRKEA